jgi:hypothetical protein
MKTPLVTNPQRISGDFDASLIVTWVDGALVGAFFEEGQSYLMRWSSPEQPYEPLVAVGWRVAQLAGAPQRSRVVAVVGEPSETRHPVGVFVLDFEKQVRAELVDPETGLMVSADGAQLVWSPDGRHIAIGNVSVKDDPASLTVVFVLDAGEERRWLLSGVATRWDADGLVLLREHGCTRWTPETGDTFVGDAPPLRSSDGTFSVIRHDAALEIRGADAIERRYERAGDDLEVLGWIGPDKLLVGSADPVVLALDTLETQPLVDATASAFMFLEARDLVGGDGRDALTSAPTRTTF